MARMTYPILFGLLFGVVLALFASPWSPMKQQGPVSYADAVSRAAPSVVNIYTTKAVRSRTYNNYSNDPILNYFLNQRQRRFQQKQELSLGSGVIVSKEGFILTCYHVIRDAEEILVLLYDGREALATVIGTDQESDLAVLRVALDNLTPITFGKPEKLRVGDPVLAIGNPYGFGQSVTAGIVSATRRHGLNLNTYEDFIQTDADINLGSSGGALINGEGLLVGINSAIYSQTGGSQGIGLAIPIDIASKVMTDLIQRGQVIRGWLGLEAAQVEAMVVITRIYPGSPAERAGVLPGDILLAIDGKPIRSGKEGLFEVASLQPGTTIQIELKRDNQTLLLSTIVGIRPATEKP